MSSLARRTLRTTAAAAGMAALGVGLAGNALAAPAHAPQAPEPTLPAVPALPALPTGNILAKLPGVTPGQPLPKLFVFQGPKINTAGPSAAPVRTQPVASAQFAPTTAGPRNQSNQVAPAAAPDRAGALSVLDSAGMFGDLLAHSAVDQRDLGTSGLRLNGLG